MLQLGHPVMVLLALQLLLPLSQPWVNVLASERSNLCCTRYYAFYLQHSKLQTSKTRSGVMACCLMEYVVFSRKAEQSQGNKMDFSVSFLKL